jgi:Flp pilus assembly protein TadB
MPPVPPPGQDRRLALYTLVVCVLAVAAAVVSFVQGSFLGIVWVLLAGLSSHMTWYYMKRDKARRAAGADVTG